MNKKISLPVWAIAVVVILLPVVGWLYAEFLMSTFGVCGKQNTETGELERVNLCSPMPVIIFEESKF